MNCCFVSFVKPFNYFRVKIIHVNTKTLAHVFSTSLINHFFLNFSLLTLSLLQLNADCLDDLPLDYDLALGGVGGVGVGGVGALALEAVVSGASSDGTLSEGGSSVVLDPGVRRVGLPQDYQDPDTLRDSPVTATTDTHTGNTVISGVILTPGGLPATLHFF